MLENKRLKLVLLAVPLVILGLVAMFSVLNTTDPFIAMFGTVTVMAVFMALALIAIRIKHG